MKWFCRFLGLIFAIAGTLAAVLGVWLCMENLDSIPVLLEPVEEAQKQAESLMEAVCEGDYETAGSLILGNPQLGVDRPPEEEAGELIWQALLDSYSYEMIGTCYATDSGVAQNVRVTYLDLSSVTANLRDRSQRLMEARILMAEDIMDIYTEENTFREDFVMEALRDAVKEALREDARLITVELTLNLIYRDGTWMIVSDDALMQAISGGIVK